MRFKIAGIALTFIASFVLSACGDDDVPNGDTSSNEAPVEIDFDFDSKTKTVTVPPTLTPAPYKPPTTKTTTKRPVATTKARTTR